MTNEVLRQKKSRLRLIIVAAILLVLTYLAGLFWPEPALEIGRETTVISEPLNADGTPNYVAAIDSIMVDGITAENNSCPLLLQVCGLNYEMPEELLQRIGLTQADLGDGKGMLIPWRKWLADTVERPADKEYDGPGTVSSLPQEPYTDSDWYQMSLGAAIQLLERGQRHPQLESWVKANLSSLELLYEASLREKCYVPMLTLSDPPLFAEMNVACNLSNLFESLELLQARALLHLHNNTDLSAAWQDVLTMHRVARSHANPGYGLMSQLIAESLSVSTSDVAIQLATGAQLPAEEARRLLSQLIELEDVSAADRIIQVFQFDRYSMLDCIIASHRERYLVAPDSYGLAVRSEHKLPPFNVNYVLRKANALHDRVQTIMAISGYQRRHEESQYFDNEMQHYYVNQRDKAKLGPFYRAGGAFTRDLLSGLVGMPMIVLSATQLEGAVRSSMRARVNHDLSIVALALSIHKAEQGQYPEKLEQLVPRILPRLPLDGFADKPLVYRSTDAGYLLYSVGQNLTDDGGVTAETASLCDAPKDDMVVSVPPANKATPRK